MDWLDRWVGGWVGGWVGTFSFLLLLLCELLDVRLESIHFLLVLLPQAGDFLFGWVGGWMSFFLLLLLYELVD